MKQAWLDELADHARKGIRHYRVRLFEYELSEHEIYECNWGYALNSPHEEIRVLRRGEHALPEDLIEVEYWVVNDATAIVVTYDRQGRFRGAGWLGPQESAEYVRRSRPYVARRRAVRGLVGSAPGVPSIRQIGGITVVTTRQRSGAGRDRTSRLMLEDSARLPKRGRQHWTASGGCGCTGRPDPIEDEPSRTGHVHSQAGRSAAIRPRLWARHKVK